ncbi:MAG: hypothetical protein A3G41_05675 [Elusimicrobia bacterium RIFCSPLOWO2_12_FULL_59_9]|nr:MAG: hypothetical protein A3G41_05675 [Elusimicrobia bacterium RIFCSPLOWO2_12_FULL_59_9]
MSDIQALDPNKHSERLEDFSRRKNFPYLLGVYLALNAIRDLYLLVDGPDCNLHKAEFIYGKHDWNSNLLDPSGMHRVVFSNVTINDVGFDWQNHLRVMVKRIAGVPECGAVMLTGMPFCSLTGLQYDRVPRETKDAVKPVIDLVPGSLQGDWLDGYAEVLSALAGAVDLPPRDAEPHRVAVVGLMMDRTEEDHLGNVRELRRMLEALNLELVSVWPANEPYASLSRVAAAQTILSLPYGRKAARLLAQRTGARILELEVPFGLESTRRWLLQIAQFFGRSDQADRFIERELARTYSKLEWLIPYAFLNREISFFVDPHLVHGMVELAEGLGMRIRGAVATARQEHLGESAGGSKEDGSGILFEPNALALQEILGNPGELVIGNSFVTGAGELKGNPACVELGFPSWYSHALVDAPFLGFEGYLSFVNRMSNALSAKKMNALKGPPENYVKNTH